MEWRSLPQRGSRSRSRTICCGTWWPPICCRWSRYQSTSLLVMRHSGVTARHEPIAEILKHKNLQNDRLLANVPNSQAEPQPPARRKTPYCVTAVVISDLDWQTGPIAPALRPPARFEICAAHPLELV